MKEKKKHPVLKRVIRYILFLCALVALFILVSWFFSSKVKKTYTAPVNPVYTTKAEKRVLKESFSLSGYIEADAMIPVVPFVQGTIKEYPVHAGDKVEEGDLIAVIDREPYRLQTEQAKAAFLAYDATFKRVEALYNSGAATKQNYDEVKAQRDATSSQYELAKLQEDYCRVTSPVSGTVLIADQAVGGIGNTQTPLAIIADLNNLVVNVSVPEKYFSTLVNNKDSLSINVKRISGGDESSAKCELVSLSEYIDPTTKTFKVKVKLSENVNFFRPGMFVNLEIIYKEENVWALKQDVRRLDGGMYYIERTYDDDGNEVNTAKYLELPYLLSDEDYFEIDEKYKDYEFVYSGQNNILSGERVNIVGGDV